ncbi:MAG: ABA4-like family protein [Sandaracinaceae bacterium]
MSHDELIFAVCNYSVLPAWLGLVVAPRSRFTELVVHSGAMCGLLAIAYAWLLFGDSPGPQGAHFFTLEGVTRIFTTPRTITACWVHYLVFDLFVGAWIARDAARLGIRHLHAVPSMVLTLLFGPVGLVSWLAIRAITRKRRSLDERASAG